MKYQFSLETNEVLQLVPSESIGENIFDDVEEEINASDLNILNINGHIIGKKYKIVAGEVQTLPLQKYIYACNADNVVVGFKGMNYWRTVPAAGELWLDAFLWDYAHLHLDGYMKYEKLTSTTWGVI